MKIKNFLLTIMIAFLALVGFSNAQFDCYEEATYPACGTQIPGCHDGGSGFPEVCYSCADLELLYAGIGMPDAQTACLTEAGSPAHGRCTWSNESCVDTNAATSCGNGIVEVYEGCDDGGTDNGDGCDSSCSVELGYTCIGTPSSCSICGNGSIDGLEQCDDGANNGIYGYCNDTCTSVLECGNGSVDGLEQCDDGANNGIYGYCNDTCTSVLECGNGSVDGLEQCDDGANNGIYGYCNDSCSVVVECGDGIVQELWGEICDDGNNFLLDGCVASCGTEHLYDCNSSGCQQVEWYPVGQKRFSDGRITNTSFAIDSNDFLYVSYRDIQNGSQATVMRYKGDDWEVVGQKGFSSGSAGHPTLELNSSGDPHVVYWDADSTSTGLTVMKYNGSNWETIGVRGFNNVISRDVDMAFDSNDIPYLVYQDGSNGDDITVMKRNGSAWEVVGTRWFVGGRIQNPSMLIDDNDIIYIAFYDGSAGGKVSVMKYNGSSWEYVGIQGISDDYAYRPILIMDSNNDLYISYYDGFVNGITVMKYNGSSWEPIGVKGFLSASQHNIAFDQNDVLYGMFSENEDSDKKMTVMRYNGNNWEFVGDRKFSEGINVGSPEIRFDSKNNIYISYEVYVPKSNGDKDREVVVRRYNPEPVNHLNSYIEGFLDYPWRDMTLSSVISFNNNWKEILLPEKQEQKVIWRFENDTASVTDENTTIQTPFGEWKVGAGIAAGEEGALEINVKPFAPSIGKYNTTP